MATEQSTTAAENWKPVVGWESLYEVSDLGRVRRRTSGRVRNFSPKRSRYYRITLKFNRKRTATKLVHWMVLEAFVGPRPEGAQALHTNDNPRDNRLENLRWGTAKENSQDRRRNNGGILNTGEANGRAKLRETVVLEIRKRVERGEKHAALAVEYRVDRTTIRDIASGKIWKHVA